MTSPTRGSRWLPWLGGIAALGAMLILSVVFRVQAHRGRVWPILQTVAARAATDAGARDLYAKNPELAGAYASEAAFVEAMRAGMQACGALPGREPAERREAYDIETEPDGFRAFIKGAQGGWMLLEVRQSDGTEAGHAAIGEGVTYLGFAGSLASLRDLRRTQHDARLEARWKTFLALEKALLTEDGTRALLQAHPELAPQEAARAAFLRQAAAWRPHLSAEPPPPTWAAAPEGRVRFLRRQAPIVGDAEELGWQVKDGAWFRAAWKNGRLIRIALGDGSASP